MEGLLVELESLLRGHNYEVFLRVYRVAFVLGTRTADYVGQTLGPTAVLGGETRVERVALVAEVEAALRYKGDYASGPRPAVLRLQRYKELVAAVLTKLECITERATSVTAFSLREGHPAYPVFWDFAYVIAGPAETLVFIGSSSD